jgi:hypothetical protein
MEVLAERGIDVSNRTVLRWVQAFGPRLAAEARKHRRPLGRHWYTDEIFFFRGKEKWYLYRAVDEHGQVVDVLLREHRDTASAEAFFEQALRPLRPNAERDHHRPPSAVRQGDSADGTDSHAHSERVAPRDWTDDQADRTQSRADTGSSARLAWVEDIAHRPAVSGRLRMSARLARRAHPVGRSVASVLSRD